MVRLEYGSERQSRKVDKWLTKLGITFELSSPYSQEEIGVSEGTGRTIIYMVRATIFEGGMDDPLGPKIVLAMIPIKNLLPTRAMKGFISPIEMQNQAIPDLHHLRILGSNVYVFLHEKKRSPQSIKPVPSVESSWDSTATLSIGSTSKIKTKSSGSKTYESTKTSPQRRQYTCKTSSEDPSSMESKYQMRNRRLTKVVPPKRKKTH